MLPLGLFRDRNRSGSYATMLFIGAGLMGTFYLLALYLQQVLGFTPLWTGLASLPFSAGIILGAGISSKLVERLAPRLVAGPGLLLGALGMLWLSALAVDSSYAAHIMPALFLTSFGLGMAAVTMTLTAVHGVAEDRAGVASALVNMAQQIGAALGLAVFTTISISAANERLPGAATVLQEGTRGQRRGRRGEGRRGADPRLHRGLPRRCRDAADRSRRRDRGHHHQANARSRDGTRRGLICSAGPDERPPGCPALAGAHPHAVQHDARLGVGKQESGAAL